MVFHKDNPAEKLTNLGGPLTARNARYGYSTCFSVWDPSSFTDNRDLKTGSHFVLAAIQQLVQRCQLQLQGHSPRTDVPGSQCSHLERFRPKRDQHVCDVARILGPLTANRFQCRPDPHHQASQRQYDPVAAADSMTGYKDIFSAKNPSSCTANGLTKSNCARLNGSSWDPNNRGQFVGSDNKNEGEKYLLTPK